MAIKRNVYATGKDSDGDITKLCNSAAWWSPRSKADAIRDIENDEYEYWSNGRAKIFVYQSGGKKHLRTAPNADTDDNLDNLPPC